MIISTKLKTNCKLLKLVSPREVRGMYNYFAPNLVYIEIDSKTYILTQHYGSCLCADMNLSLVNLFIISLRSDSLYDGKIIKS